MLDKTVGRIACRVILASLTGDTLLRAIRDIRRAGVPAGSALVADVWEALGKPINLTAFKGALKLMYEEGEIELLPGPSVLRGKVVKDSEIRVDGEVLTLIRGRGPRLAPNMGPLAPNLGQVLDSMKAKFSPADVKQAARKVPATSTKGGYVSTHEYLALVGDVWEKMGRPVPLEDFKKALYEMYLQRRLVLTRSDMPQFYDTEQLRKSVIHDGSRELVFIDFR
jgi:hypothetical protein